MAEPPDDKPQVTIDQSSSAVDEQENSRLYDEHRRQTWADIQSSTDSFDKSMLAISSAALGLSLTFIKDVVPLTDAEYLWALYTSWIAFGLCITLTVFSFQLSIGALNKNLVYLYEFYKEGKQDSFNKEGWCSRCLSAFTWLTCVLFLAGLVCTLIFCVHNVSREHMKEAEGTRLTEGRKPVSMTPTADERGRPPLPMTPVAPTQTPSSNPTTPAPSPAKK